MITHSDVANQILRKCIDKLRVNELEKDGLIMASSICHNERYNPECIDLINEYTKLADEKTDGVFSLTLESWIQVMH